jgi:ribosomal protein L11 methylase PrmA
VGTYELELSDIIEKIVRHGYTRVLNIGCAEGYYAIGLALRDPAVEVFAFDTDPLSRMQTRRLARLNRVSHRVHVEGECKHARVKL